MRSNQTPVEHERNGLGIPRQAPPVDMSLRRANLLARLDIERARAPRRDPIAELQVRLERVEAAVYQLACEVARWKPS